MKRENTGKMVLNRLAPHTAATNLVFLTNTASVKRSKAKCCMYSTCVRAESLQSCPTLSDSMDCSPPGSSIHGIFQARVLEWGVIAFSSSYKWLQFLNSPLQRITVRPLYKAGGEERAPQAPLSLLELHFSSLSLSFFLSCL